jgi:hypothetical protein
MQNRGENYRQSAVNRRDILLASTAVVATSALGGTAAFDVTQAQAAETQSSLTEQEARAIGIDAYLYFYSLITMDITRKQFTNIEGGKEIGRGPMNAFWSVPRYPPVSDKGVVRYNFDTLYSPAWLDMTKEPIGLERHRSGGDDPYQNADAYRVDYRTHQD